MTFVSAVLSNSFKSRIASLFSMNLSRLFHCSVIKVLCSLSLRQLLYFIKSICLCQQLFYFSLLLFQATACLSYHQRSALSTTFFFPSRSFSRTDCRIPCRLLSLLFFCMCRRISDSLLIIALLPAEVNTFRADLSK